MKLDKNSIGVKLWLYFIGFAAVILILLWFMQIVFLQSFYEQMKIKDITSAANTIIEKYGIDDFENTIDALAFHNSILVIVTDFQGNIIYVSDEHGFNPRENGDFRPGGSPRDFGRMLPQDYNIFLERLSQSENGHISYTTHNARFAGKSLVYGVILPDAVLYISTPLDPVNATTDILRTQLAYVTIIALLLSFIIAYFIAKRFSTPIAAISEQANRLAEGDFDVTFNKGFCAEIDGLATTLDHTAVELSKVEKLRRELIANISHDLRTPLTMVKAYSEMIRDISGDNREKRESNLKIIIEEADRLTSLVNDVLDLSSIQSGIETFERDNVNLSDIVLRVLSRFEPLAEHEGYTIESTLEPDQYVLADSQKIEQVLYNLIGNSVNYIGDDKLISVSLIDLGGKTRFEVHDNGVGIPEDELSLIWDRYYKSRTHKRSADGTGLGLSIVKGILEAHGAKFGVTSNIGNGSTFWFELEK